MAFQYFLYLPTLPDQAGQAKESAKRQGKGFSDLEGKRASFVLELDKILNANIYKYLWCIITADEVETEDMNEIFLVTYVADYQPETTRMARYANIVTLALPRKVSECYDICNTADCLALSYNQVSAMVTAMVSAAFKAEGDDLNI